MTPHPQPENIHDGCHYIIDYNDIMRIRGYMIRARVEEGKCIEFEEHLCRNTVPCNPAPAAPEPKSNLCRQFPNRTIISATMAHLCVGCYYEDSCTDLHESPTPTSTELTVGMVSAYEQGFKDGLNQTLDDVRKELREEYCSVTEGVDWDSIDAVLIRLRTQEHQR